MYLTMALLPFGLLLLGFPIFLLLLATSFVVMIFFFPVPLTAIHQIIFNSLNKYALLAVPFFIFAGDLMSRGGISKRLLRWVAAIIGGFRGSIPLTSLGFAAMFGAISGVTTAATVRLLAKHLPLTGDARAAFSHKSPARSNVRSYSTRAQCDPVQCSHLFVAAT